MEKHYKNNRELRKDILENCRNITERKVLVRCYTSTDEDNIYTDLDVDLYSLENDYINTFTVATLKGIDEDNFHDVLEQHRNEFKVIKQKLFKYLNQYFPNVTSGDDYTQ